MLLDFRQWSADGHGISGGDPDDVVEVLQMLLDTAQAADGVSHLLPPDPDLVTDMLQNVVEQNDAIRVPIVETMHDYLSFLDQHPSHGGINPIVMLRCHAAVHQALDRLNDPAPLVAQFLDADDDGPSARLQDLKSVRLVSAVDNLLGWLGRGITVTSKGGLRRPDIAPVARMLGIIARGVSSHREDADTGESGTEALFDSAALGRSDAPLRVLSMWEVPALAAWWNTMVKLELLELSSTRAYPGEAVNEWRSEDASRAAAIRQRLVSEFIVEFLALEAEPYQGAGFSRYFAQHTIPVTVQLLIVMLRLGEQSVPEMGEPSSIGLLRSKVLLNQMVKLGVVQGDGEDYSVLAGLRPAVAEAVLGVRNRLLGYAA